MPRLYKPQAPAVKDHRVTEAIAAKTEGVDAGLAAMQKMFGANGAAVQEILVRIQILTPEEITALAAAWRPSMDFLYAQTQAWKLGKARHLEGALDFAYNSVHSSVSHAHPDWDRAGNVAAHTVLGRALKGRLAPKLVEVLTASWDQIIKPLPAATATKPKIKVSKASERPPAS
jgi:hypothetical protein